MLEPIILPKVVEGKSEEEATCECQKKRLDLTHKAVAIFWKAEEGDQVKEGQQICEGEVEKRVVEVYASCDGILKEILVEDGDEIVCEGETVLGYLETDQ
ncbi:MAG: biotin/lipoyl-containing protein [Lachnospiraceae bacterium]|nr:biotin/lipoyl-containing protein [Lachnospiraceae bacterium]